jgi:hypothetical protein
MHEQFLLPALYQRLASMLYFETLLGAAPLFPIAAALPAIDPNDDDFACFCSYREHDSSSWVSKKQYNIKVSGVREWISLETDTDVPLTTLCNGQPRTLESYKSFEVTSTETPDLSGTTARYATPTFTTAKIACAAIEAAFPDDLADCDAPASYEAPPLQPLAQSTGYNCATPLLLQHQYSLQIPLDTRTSPRISVCPTSRMPSSAIIGGYGRCDDKLLSHRTCAGPQ